MFEFVKIFFSLITLVSIWLMSNAYEKSMFEYSVLVIPGMQNDTSHFMKLWYAFTSDFFFYAINIIPIAVTYVRMNDSRPRCFYYFFLVFGIDAMSAMLKLHRHQPRPFWVSADIEALSCVKQYGNPSGHSFSCMGLACAIWLDYNSWIGKHPEKTLSKWYWRTTFLLLALAFGGYIAYSRVLLGVHSINQVLFGLMLGVWYAGTAHFIVNKPLKKLIRACLEGKETRLLRLFLISSAIYLTLIIVQIINFENMKSFKNPAEWIKNA